MQNDRQVEELNVELEKVADKLRNAGDDKRRLLTYIHTYKHTYIDFVHINKYIYACMYVCMYVYVCMYIGFLFNTGDLTYAY